jgi:hypothetical protein
MHHNHVKKVMEEHKDIYSSPTRVPLQCQVKNSIDLTLGAPLPNGIVYHLSLMENEKIQHLMLVTFLVLGTRVFRSAICMRSARAQRKKISFHTSKQVSGKNYIVDGPDSSIRADR